MEQMISSQAYVTRFRKIAILVYAANYLLMMIPLISVKAASDSLSTSYPHPSTVFTSSTYLFGQNPPSSNFDHSSLVYKSRKGATRGDCPESARSFYKDLSLDVWHPNTPTGQLIFHVHGGGWQLGDASVAAWSFGHFLERGVAIVSAQYGLMCSKVDGKYISATDMVADLTDAYGYIRDELAMNMSDVTIVGESAGAHLAMLLAFSNRTKFKRVFNVYVLAKRVRSSGDAKRAYFIYSRSHASFTRACISRYVYLRPPCSPPPRRRLHTSTHARLPRRYGISSLTLLKEEGYTSGGTKGMEWPCGEMGDKMWRLGGSRDCGENALEMVSPMFYLDAQDTLGDGDGDTTTLPPVPTVFSIHGTADSLVPYSQSVKLHDKLDELGVENHAVTLPGYEHVFDFGYNGAGQQLLRSALVRLLEVGGEGGGGEGGGGGQIVWLLGLTTPYVALVVFATLMNGDGTASVAPATV